MHKHHLKLHLKQLFAVLAISALLIVVSVSLKNIGMDRIVIYLKQNLVVGIFIFFIYNVLATVIVTLPSVPLWPFALFLYGFWPATILSISGTIVGAYINFELARKFGKPLVTHMMGKKLYEEIDHLINISNPKMFLFLRIFGNNYFDTISYMAGLSKIPFRSYLLTTALASSGWIFGQMKVIEGLGGIENTKSFIAVMSFYGGVVLIGTLTWEIYHKHHIVPHLKMAV